MKSESSAKFTLWCGRAISVVIVVLCFFLKDVLSWYHSFRELSWQSASAILAGYYLCVPLVLYALWCMDGLMRSVLWGQVFAVSTVKQLRRIRWCCAGVSLVSLGAGFLYQPLMFLFLIMAFLALTVSVLKNVMAAAVELREENDLTV